MIDTEDIHVVTMQFSIINHWGVKGDVTVVARTNNEGSPEGALDSVRDILYPGLAAANAESDESLAGARWTLQSFKVEKNPV